MASSKEYLNFILAQLSDLEDVSCRAMMGEYILYYKGKIVGGIYDDRLLVKPVKSAVRYMPDARSTRCLMKARGKCYWWIMWMIRTI